MTAKDLLRQLNQLKQNYNSLVAQAEEHIKLLRQVQIEFENLEAKMIKAIGDLNLVFSE